MHRNRTAILIEILIACASPKKITHLMQTCNVSYPYLQERVESLVRAGFLEVIDTDDVDKRTKKLIGRTVKGNELIGIKKNYVSIFDELVAELEGIVKAVEGSS